MNLTGKLAMAGVGVYATLMAAATACSSFQSEPVGIPSVCTVVGAHEVYSAAFFRSHNLQPITLQELEVASSPPDPKLEKIWQLATVYSALEEGHTRGSFGPNAPLPLSLLEAALQGNQDYRGAAVLSCDGVQYVVSLVFDQGWNVHPTVRDTYKMNLSTAHGGAARLTEKPVRVFGPFRPSA